MSAEFLTPLGEIVNETTTIQVLTPLGEILNETVAATTGAPKTNKLLLLNVG